MELDIQMQTLRTIYQYSKDFVVLTDHNLLVLWANDAAFARYPILTQPGGVLTLIPTALSGEIIMSREPHSFYFPLLQCCFSETPVDNGFLLTMHPAEGAPASTATVAKLFLSTFSTNMREPLSKLFIQASAINQMGELLENQRLHDISKEVNNDTYILYRGYSLFCSYLKFLGNPDAANLSTVNLADFLDRLCMSLSVSCLNANIPVVCSIKENAFVRTDSDKLLEAIMHIVSNSCKYSRDGNVIKLSLSTTSNMAIITISDNGLGIPAHLTQRVFEPFFTFTHEDINQGVGLGLTLAQLIVTSLGGTIALSSQEGDGTTVAISIPLEKNVMYHAFNLPDSISDMYRNRFSPMHIYLCESCGAPTP